VLLRGPLAHVGADLAQDHQGCVLVDPFQYRQVVAAQAVQGRAHAEGGLVATAAAPARLRCQLLAPALVGEGGQVGLQFLIALPQQLLVFLIERERLPEGEQVLLTPVPLEGTGDFGLGPLAALVP
jgi:hypothetical protein